MHVLFDKGWWLLLPGKELLERYRGGEMPVFAVSGFRSILPIHDYTDGYSY